MILTKFYEHQAPNKQGITLYMTGYTCSGDDLSVAPVTNIYVSSIQSLPEKLELTPIIETAPPAREPDETISFITPV